MLGRQEKKGNQDLDEYENVTENNADKNTTATYPK